MRVAMFFFFPLFAPHFKDSFFTLIFQLYTILQLGCKSFPLILHRQSTNECTDLIIIKKNESQKE